MGSIIEDIGTVSYPTPLLKSQATQRVPDTDYTAEWPRTIDSELAWSGSQFSNQDLYTLLLSPADLAEIANALEHFKSNGEQTV